jgi:hypothetical protein
MQINRNEGLVRRRKRIGQITSLLGMGVLVGGMAFTWLAPRWEVPLQLTVYIPILSLLVGFVLSSIGIYFTNHWGRSPRPDELIDQSLKGLGREHKLYHFAFPASHLLLTPRGLVVLIVRSEPGEYRVEGDKWRQRFSVRRVLRFMGQEGLGNPTKEARYQIEKMRRFLGKHAAGLKETPISAIIVFLASAVDLTVGETHVPVLRAAKLKGFLRAQTEPRLPRSTYDSLEELLGRASGSGG